MLVLVAAGLLATAAHTAHEAGWLNSLQGQAFNLEWLVHPGSVRAALLTGMFGLQPRPVWAEVIVWLAYAIPFGVLVVIPRRPKPAGAGAVELQSPISTGGLNPMRRTTILAAAAALAIAVSACGSSSKTASTTGAKKVAIKLTKAGCDPAKLELPAGPTTFEITNDDADAVSEFEVLDGARVLGEKENLTPGLSGTFTITLKPGTYTTLCPGGSTTPKGELIVAGGDSATTMPPRLSAAASNAVATYRDYVESEATKLVTDATAFVNAVKAGDVDEAKRLFPGARTHYETIEPIAESFGDLDPEIDARANDVPAAEFEGFHRIEQQMWEKGTPRRHGARRDELLDDVKELQSRIPDIELEPAQIANGAVELLNEVVEQDHRRGRPLLAHRPLGLRSEPRRRARRVRRAAADRGRGGCRAHDEDREPFTASDDALAKLQRRATATCCTPT